MSENDYLWASCFSALGWWHFLLRLSKSKDRGFRRVVEVVILAFVGLVLGFLWPFFVALVFISIPELLAIIDKYNRERGAQ